MHLELKGQRFVDKVIEEFFRLAKNYSCIEKYRIEDVCNCLLKKI